MPRPRRHRTALTSVPPPDDNPIARLAHTLQIYNDLPDDEPAVVATRGVYGDGVVTGITWGDLRRIHLALAMRRQDTEASSNDDQEDAGL